MYVVSALALTPAAMMRLANVCLASWSVIGSRPAARQTFDARALTGSGSNGEPSALRAHLVFEEHVAQDRRDRHSAAPSSALRLDDHAALRIPRPLDSDHPS